MTRLLIRLLQRLAILGLGIVSIWLIVFVVFDFADQRLPWAVALGLSYAIGAYVILPRAVRMGVRSSSKSARLGTRSLATGCRAIRSISR
jgi:hypothetical protein